jgi:hypothetical protein
MFGHAMDEMSTSKGSSRHRPCRVSLVFQFLILSDSGLVMKKNEIQ